MGLSCRLKIRSFFPQTNEHTWNWAFYWKVEFGVSSFSGAWILEFGASLYCRRMNNPSITPSSDYLAHCRRLIDAVAAQQSAIRKAADWFAKTILAGRMVHVFGSGHSRIMVEEMWPRYGSFPGF